MGIEDRDYFWEDRKRREERFRRDTYYRPKEFRSRRGQKPPNDWKQPPVKRQCMIIGAFFLGMVTSLLIVVAIIFLNPSFMDFVHGYLVGFFNAERLE